MDAERFDGLTRAMANGATRRRALRLAGGAVAGALLAAVGVGKRAEAQDRGVIFTNCEDREPGEGPTFQTGPDDQILFAKPCPGCPHDRVCIAVVNPEGRLFCRCAKLD